MQVVITQLSAILKSSDAEIGDTGTWPGRIKKDVERWLSDWHLVTFLCMQGLFSLVSGVKIDYFVGTNITFSYRRSRKSFAALLRPMRTQMTLSRWKSFSQVMDGRHCSPLSIPKFPVRFFFSPFSPIHSPYALTFFLKKKPTVVPTLRLHHHSIISGLILLRLLVPLAVVVPVPSLLHHHPVLVQLAQAQARVLVVGRGFAHIARL